MGGGIQNKKNIKEPKLERTKEKKKIKKNEEKT